MQVCLLEYPAKEAAGGKTKGMTTTATVTPEIVKDSENPTTVDEQEQQTQAPTEEQQQEEEEKMVCSRCGSDKTTIKKKKKSQNGKTYTREFWPEDKENPGHKICGRCYSRQYHRLIIVPRREERNRFKRQGRPLPAHLIPSKRRRGEEAATIGEEANKPGNRRGNPITGVVCAECGRDRTGIKTRHWENGTVHKRPVWTRMRDDPSKFLCTVCYHRLYYALKYKAKEREKRKQIQEQLRDHDGSLSRNVSQTQQIAQVSDLAGTSRRKYTKRGTMHMPTCPCCRSDNVLRTGSHRVDKSDESLEQDGSIPRQNALLSYQCQTCKYGFMVGDSMLRRLALNPKAGVLAVDLYIRNHVSGGAFAGDENNNNGNNNGNGKQENGSNNNTSSGYSYKGTKSLKEISDIIFEQFNVRHTDTILGRYISMYKDLLVMYRNELHPKDIVIDYSADPGIYLLAKNDPKFLFHIMEDDKKEWVANKVLDYDQKRRIDRHRQDGCVLVKQGSLPYTYRMQDSDDQLFYYSSSSTTFESRKMIEVIKAEKEDYQRKISEIDAQNAVDGKELATYTQKAQAAIERMNRREAQKAVLQGNERALDIRLSYLQEMNASIASSAPQEQEEEEEEEEMTKSL